MSTLDTIRQELRHFADPQKAAFFPRFFKTGKGQYGEGDRFIGVTVPHIKEVTKHHNNLSLSECKILLYSPIHEERMTALMILVNMFQKSDSAIRKTIYDFYLSNAQQVNNWDLVDCSADKIVGGYLVDKVDRSILTTLARSSNLWERRIAIIATYQFIKHQKEHVDTFTVALLLLHDTHDLIHKAVGWMLREVGKRISKELEEEFLKKHYKTMPRTMLRYALEHFPEKKRGAYLKGEIV